MSRITIAIYRDDMQAVIAHTKTLLNQARTRRVQTATPLTDEQYDQNLMQHGIVR
jgi:hypothetical protein